MNFAAGTAAEDASSRDHKAVHGVLMLSSWGLLIPLGTLAAAWGGARFKVGGPKLFNAHRWLQSLGLLLSLAGVSYAMMLIYNGNLSKIAELPMHGLIGLAVTVIGVLQPLNAILRPHGDGMLRVAWELLHKTMGRFATVAGLLNCILGAVVARQQEGDEALFSTLLPASFAMNFSTLMLASIAMCTFFVISYVGGKVVTCVKAAEIRRAEAADAAAADIEAQAEPNDMIATPKSPESGPVLLGKPAGNVLSDLPKETGDMVHEVVSLFLANRERLDEVGVRNPLPGRRA